jgi:hypothetical protein
LPVNPDVDIHGISDSYSLAKKSAKLREKGGPVRAFIKQNLPKREA